MAIAIQCACGKKFKAKDDQAGRKFRCSQCGASIAVPPHDDSSDDREFARTSPLLPCPLRSFPGGLKTDESDVTTAGPKRPAYRIRTVPPPMRTNAAGFTQKSSRIKPAPIECPTCGSDNWQRVEVAYSAGTSAHSGIALFTGSGGGMDAGLLSGTTWTHFAERIAPPKRQPEAWAFLFLAALGALTALFGGLFVFITIDSHKSIDLFGGVVLIAGLILLAVSLIWLAKARSFNRNEWPVLMEEWRRHFVCLKCGCVWIHDDLSPP